MALHASDRRALPYLERRVQAIHDGGDAEFLVVRAALRIGHRVPVKRGGDQLLRIGVREQVARQLFHREPVEWHILVERLDDPVAVSPDGAGKVFFVSVRVGVAGQVEPVARPAFAESGRGEQPVDRGFVRSVGRIRAECVGVFRGGRQPRQIKACAPQQHPAIRLRGRAQVFPIQPGQHEAVDVVFWPCGVGHGRHVRRGRGHVRPVRLPFGAAVDPAFQQVYFPAPERRRFGGHAFVGIGVRNAPDEFAFAGLPRNDCIFPRFGGLQRVVAEQEAQLALPPNAAVARYAMFVENRTDILIEIDVVVSRSSCPQHNGARRQDNGDREGSAARREGEHLLCRGRDDALQGMQMQRITTRFLPWRPERAPAPDIFP